MKRSSYVVCAASMALLMATACQPQRLDVQISASRYVILKTMPDGTQTVTVNGIKKCSHGVNADGEHLDTFIEVDNLDESRKTIINNGVFLGDHDGKNLRCSTEAESWSITWAVEPEWGEELTIGNAFIRVTVSTNPGEPLDEAGDQYETYGGVVLAG
jgi:hypothetical protein